MAMTVADDDDGSTCVIGSWLKCAAAPPASIMLCGESSSTQMSYRHRPAADHQPTSMRRGSGASRGDMTAEAASAVRRRRSGAAELSWQIDDAAASAQTQWPRGILTSWGAARGAGIAKALCSIPRLGDIHHSYCAGHSPLSEILVAAASPPRRKPAPRGDIREPSSGGRPQ